MAKRFTDDAKWDDPWYRELPCKYKNFWQYVLDKCNKIGLWKKDIKTATYFIGERIDEVRALELFNSGKQRIKILDDGRLWLILDFVEFQYGELKPTNNFHRSLISLRDSSLKFSPCPAPDQPHKKGKDKEEERNNKGGVGGFSFDRVWMIYPRKLGKNGAERHFEATVKTREDFIRLVKALGLYKKYLKDSETQEQYIQHGSTWFNNWEDWLNYKIEKKEIDRNHPKNKVVLAWKVISGYDINDESWDKAHWDSIEYPAQRLLEFFNGDHREAISCMESIKEKLKKSNLTCTIDTVVKHSSDWKIEQERKNGYGSQN